MSSLRKVSDLTEIPSIYDFLERNGLTMAGLSRASKQIVENGYPKERFVIKFGVGVYANVYAPPSFFLDGEKDRMILDLAGIVLPDPIPYDKKVIGNSAPKELLGVSLEPRAWKNIDWSKDDVLCPLFNEDGELVMIEQRYKDEDGAKQCLRWSYFDDFQWRNNADPEKFPFWGMDQLGRGQKTVFLHEGPKAAAAGRRFYEVDSLGQTEKRLLTSHPWFGELSKYPHLGWIGGANRADRSDWGKLKKLGIDRVIIIPDNDKGGRMSGYDIAGFMKNCEVMIFPSYPGYFPVGWDLADGFLEVDARRREYIEKSWPAQSYDEIPNNAMDITPYWYWAQNPTNADPNKMKATALPGYPKDIAHVRDIDHFLDLRGNYMIPWGKVGHHYAAHLHSSLIENYQLHVATRPDTSFDTITFEPLKDVQIYEGGKRLVNKWRPSKIVPRKMSEEGRRRWVDYLCRLAPDPVERALLMRWIATLIIHPNRKHFGVIVHSVQQGTGKTTLFEAILRPIIGEDFVSQATNDDLASRFTEYREAKVLIYADEVKGTKMIPTTDIYNKMKGWVTSDRTRIEGKGVKVYWVPDYSKILINSNKSVPIFIEDSDRRFLVIHGIERKMSRKEGEDLRGWLNDGGLEEVYGWAKDIESEPLAAIDPNYGIENEEFGRTMELDYGAGFLPSNCDAPLTESKSELLVKSMPKWQEVVESALGLLAGYDGDGESIPMALPLPSVVAMLDRALKKEGHRIGKDTIISSIWTFKWYRSNGHKSPKKSDQCNQLQGRIGTERTRRYDVVMNKPAIDFCIKNGWIDKKDTIDGPGLFVPVDKSQKIRKKGEAVNESRVLGPLLENLSGKISYMSPGSGDSPNIGGDGRTHWSGVDADGGPNRTAVVYRQLWVDVDIRNRVVKFVNENPNNPLNDEGPKGGY